MVETHNFDPYYDDFDPAKKYMQIMFKPGVAVQARELTQIQSTIQEQIERFGNHIFKNGAMVIPGESLINTRHAWIRLSKIYDNLDTDFARFVKGSEVRGVSSGATATVQFSTAATGDDAYGYLHIKSVNGIAFAQGEYITLESEDNSPIVGRVYDDAEFSGYGITATVNSGVYYVNGYFCIVDSQEIIVDKAGRTFSGKVGFIVRESYVNANEDPSLSDPARNSGNYRAPGADRFRIELVLDKVADGVEIGEDFVPLYTLKSGNPVNAIADSSKVYSELGDTMARRTYDESGDYTVRHFPVDVREHLNDGENRGIYTAEEGGDNTKFVIGMEPGKAYVRGYEFENTETIFVDFDKARTTKKLSNISTIFNLGNYVDVTNVSGHFNVSTLETVEIRDGANAQVGTARVRGFQYQSGTVGTDAVYRVWLFNVNMNAGKTFAADAKSLRAGTDTRVATIVLEGSEAVLRDNLNNNALHRIPYSFIKNLKDSAGASDTNYKVNRTFTFTTDGSGAAVVSSGSSNVTFRAQSSTNYHIVRQDTGSVVASFGVSGAGTSSISITGLAASVTYNMIATLNKNAVVERTKTLTETTEVIAHGNTVQLSQADVFEVVSIVDENLVDVTDSFELDNGQRDNFYDRGRLLFKTGVAVPTGNLTITYKYFDHGAGDYFSVDSYTGTVDYEDIQTYVSGNGEVFDLRSVMDFRPRMNTSGTAFVSNPEMAIDDEEITLDCEVYFGRVDHLYLSPNGEFLVEKGVPAAKPSAPDTSNKGMLLYTVEIPPYTISVDDIKTIMTDNRRFTMRDIGKIEKRVDRVEYYTALSLLEVNTENMFIDDGSGGNRFKSGFVVDNFTSSEVADTNNNDFQASIDPNEGILRSPFHVEFLESELSSSESSHYMVKNNIITLPYTLTAAITQPFASGTINVNPYDVATWNGSVELSPSRDIWFETRWTPDQVTFREGNFEALSAALDGGVQWGAWNSNWWGGLETRTGTRTRVVPQTVREQVGQRTLDITNIPFIRTRDVTFEAHGLRPNRRVFPYFDNVRVDDWCRPENGSFGQSLVTDGAGSITGVYRIPSNSNLRFRTGERSFRLVDSTTPRDILSVTTSANAMYTAQGTLRTEQRLITSTRNGRVIREQISDSRRRAVLWNINFNMGGNNDRDGGGNDGAGDPLAQTFFVEDDEGIFIDSIDVFFRTKDENIPVRAIIVTVENGIPTRNQLPFASSIMFPSQVNTSENSSTATRFSFQAPVYLEGGGEYAVVLMSDSNKYNVFISTMSERDILSRDLITSQPNLGSLFKSQNRSTWTPAQESDLKFTLNRCVFDTNSVGSVTFGDVWLDDDYITLNNAIETTNGSTVVKVNHRNHGMRDGSMVWIWTDSNTSQNGIPAEEFRTNHTIKNVTLDSYEFDVTTEATSTGITGGTMEFSRAARVDTFHLASTQVALPGTVINWDTSFINESGAWENYESIVVNEDISLDNTRFIYSKDTTQYSMKHLVQLASTNDKLSPVIDMETIGTTVIGNRINTLSTGEDQVSGGDAKSRYVTKTINLENPAEGLRVMFAVDNPSGTGVRVFAKLRPIGEEIMDNVNFVEIPALSAPMSAQGTFVDHEYEIDNNASFDAVQVKIVMTSGNSAVVPRIRDFRTIAVV